MQNLTRRSWGWRRRWWSTTYKINRLIELDNFLFHYSHFSNHLPGGGGGGGGIGAPPAITKFEDSYFDYDPE